MLNTIHNFLNSMLGATLNGNVIAFMVSLCIIFVALRKFLEILKWDTTLLSFTFKTVVIMIGVEQLISLAGGISIAIGG